MYLSNFNDYKKVIIFKIIGIDIQKNMRYASINHFDDVNQKSDKEFFDFTYCNTSDVSEENNLIQGGYYERQYRVSKDHQILL